MFSPDNYDENNEVLRAFKEKCEDMITELLDVAAKAGTPLMVIGSLSVDDVEPDESNRDLAEQLYVRNNMSSILDEESNYDLTKKGIFITLISKLMEDPEGIEMLLRYQINKGMEQYGSDVDSVKLSTQSNHWK
tara:strand:+ start:3127 stop:3528 length:402 start_codon:yes stop_codon:yes gene_type:complete